MPVIQRKVIDVSYLFKQCLLKVEEILNVNYTSILVTGIK